MVTTSADIRSIVVTAIKGVTIAGQSVYSPFDWPTQNDDYPMVIVSAQKERKESRVSGVGAPLFDVTTTIEIIGRTKSPGDFGDAGSAAALAQAETLKAQIETAIINNASIWTFPNGSQRITQISSIESDLTTSSTGEMPIAELRMMLQIEFIQTPEDFHPVDFVTLQGIDTNVSEPQTTINIKTSLTF